MIKMLKDLAYKIDSVALSYISFDLKNSAPTKSKCAMKPLIGITINFNQYASPINF